MVYFSPQSNWGDMPVFMSLISMSDYILRHWEGLDILLCLLYSYCSKCLLGKDRWGILFCMFADMLQGSPFNALTSEKHITKSSPTPKGKEINIYLLKGEVSNNLWKDFNTAINFDSRKNTLTQEFCFISGNIPKPHCNAYSVCPVWCFIFLRLDGKNKNKENSWPQISITFFGWILHFLCVKIDYFQVNHQIISNGSNLS